MLVPLFIRALGYGAPTIRAPRSHMVVNVQTHRHIHIRTDTDTDTQAYIYIFNGYNVGRICWFKYTGKNLHHIPHIHDLTSG